MINSKIIPLPEKSVEIYQKTANSQTLRSLTKLNRIKNYNNS